MRGYQAFKIFHIRSDLSENTPEKVFLIEHELEKIKIHLKGRYKIYGIIGTLDSIVNHILAHTGKK